MRKSLLIVLALCLMAGAAQAQNNIGFNGVGGFLGYAMPEDPIESTIAFGARADLGTIFKPNIALVAEISRWAKSYDVGYYEWSYAQTYIMAFALYQLANEMGGFLPYFGAGLGLVLGSWEYDYTGSGYDWMAKASSTGYDGSDSELCIGLLGGLKKPFGEKLMGFAELGYYLGGADTFMIKVGATYGLK